MLFSSLTEEVTCKCSKTTSKWEAEYNPSSDISSISLVDGILKFDNYEPTGDLEYLYKLIFYFNRITVKALDENNNVIASTTISVIKSTSQYLDGLRVTAYKLGYCMCNSYNNYIDASYEGTVNDLEGLDVANGYQAWDVKLQGFLSSYDVQHLGIRLNGVINIETEGKYTFIIQSDNSQLNISIDNEKKWEETGCSNYYEDEKVERTSKCAIWDYSKEEITVQLTSGYHEIEIGGYFFDNTNQLCNGYYDCISFDRTYRFSLKWKKVGETVESVIPIYYSPDYNLVAGLSFESDYYTAPINATTDIIYDLDRGQATECIGNFNSENVYIDIFKNTVKVTSSIETTIEFDIYCKTISSETNTVHLKIDFINRFVNGIVGYYLKSDNFVTSLINPILTTDKDVRVEIIKLENGVYHPYIDKPSIWDGLTPNFVNQYGVNWIGYLLINTADEYKFNMTSFHASWLYIDNKEIINNYGINYKMTSKYGTVTLTEGYHSILIVYTKNIGGSGILITFRSNTKEDDSQYKELNKYLYFVPRSDFEYTVSYGVYFINEIISTNVPIVYNNKEISDCTADPELPDGLQFENDCRITGTPLVTQEYKKYTITGKLNDEQSTMVSCTLVIRISESVTPQNLHLKDFKNNIIVENDFYVNYGRESRYLLEVDSGIVNYYEIKPVIEGFNLESITGNLYITMLEYLDSYKFEIIAHYGKNSIISRTYNFTVLSACMGKEKMHRMIFKGVKRNSCMLSLSYANNTQLFNQFVDLSNTDTYQTGIICAVPSDMIVSVTIGGKEFNYVIEIYTENVLVDTVEASEVHGKFNVNTELKKPTLIYTEINNEFYLNGNVSLFPEVKYQSSCFIVPELPSCLTFNTTTCIITGIVNQSFPITEFTITAKNILDYTEVKINITLYDEDIKTTCKKQGKTYLTLNFTGFDSSEYWSYLVYKTVDMDKSDKKSVINLNGNKLEWTYGEYYYEFCIEENNYTVVQRDTNGYGNSYYYMLTCINNIPIIKKSLAENELEYTENINTFSDYKYNTKWEFNYQYINGWDDINRITSTWPESTLYELSNNDATTCYIRKIESYKNTDDYSAFILKVSYISGILIKINGKELFRNNLPSNVEITPTTMASNKYNELTDEIFILPIPMLDEQERTIISIELHKHQSEITFPTIEISMLRIIGDKTNCLILNKFANEVTETNTNPTHVDYGFDEIPHTFWDGSLIPGWAIMRYKNHYHTYFNQLSIQPHEQYYYKPTSVTMEGYDDIDWITLAEFEGITYDKSNKKIFPNYNTTKMYSAIRITITNSDYQNRFDINEIDFHLCPLRFCPSVQELQLTPTGDIVELNCRTSGTEGIRKFLCQNDKKWIQTENTCEEGPQFMSYESKYEFKAGSIYKDVLLYLVSGNDLEFSMNPQIEGLNIDKSTGVLSGQPYYELTQKSFTFTVKNSIDTSGQNINILLSVLPSNIPVKIWSNDSVTIESGTLYNLTLFLVSGSNLEYKVDELPSGFILDKTTGTISGTTFEEEEKLVKSKFIIGNEEDNIIINVEIYIKLPTKPILIRYDNEINIIYGEEYELIQPYKCLAKSISYSVEPQLLDNLQIDSKTGIISGKVNVEPSSIEYSFKCSNNEGDSLINTVKINILISSDPVIISHVNNVTIEGGIEYNNISLCEVTGDGLGYSILPKPPVDTLIFNDHTGTLSGYTAKYFDPINTTVVITGGKSEKQVSFSFTLQSKILDIPVIVKSTILKDVILDFGDTATVVKQLFTVVGDNIVITVSPDLPRGLNLNSKTGEISGIPLVFMDQKLYTFTVTNPPSTAKETVEINISFKAVTCQADSGFPTTVAEKGGKEVTLKCGSAKSGMKTRKCYLTDEGRGIWSNVDESDCKMSNGSIAGIVIGSVAVGLILIIGIVFCLLRTGVFTKKATASAKSKGIHKIEVDDKQSGAVRM